MAGDRTTTSAASVESIHRTALEWLRDGRRVVACTLIETDGSSPLDPGATMLVDEHGQIEGSVTGGCVEGALFEEAQAILAGAPARVRTYGIADSDAIDVGLMCGGTVHVLVHELPPDAVAPLEELVAALDRGEPAAVATLVDGERAGAKMVVAGERARGALGVSPRMERAVRNAALGAVGEGQSATRRFGALGETMGSDLRVYIEAFAPPPRMIIFGAIDFSAAVAEVAKLLGYHVTICDARRPFLSGERFRVADELAVDWPDRYLAGVELSSRDVVLVFTHDPKFDEPALSAALETGAGYIGALGSRRTHADRLQRLREAGISERELARVSSPCGLDIGGRTPVETAVSIMAEVIALRSGRAGGRLAGAGERIHPPRRTVSAA